MRALLLTLVIAATGAANDTVFLAGQVRISDGSAVKSAVEIRLDCKGADHAVRQTVTDKKGKYNLRVERDEFNHVARTLPATAVDLTAEPSPASCRVIAALPGYTSSSYSLASLDLSKGLRVPDLVLTPFRP